MRAASSWTASFLVDADAAQALVEPTGLEVARPLPGKAVLSIPVVRYTDSDLEAYNEVGVVLLVRPHDARRPRVPVLEVARGRIGIYVHHLPVDQAFTLEAGRALWGYPKFLARIETRDEDGAMRCDLREDGTHILSLHISARRGAPFPSQSPPTYTFLGGTLRRTEWSASGAVRARFGGASLVLGEHPIAEELRALGLPKRAFHSQTTAQLRASFHPAATVE